MLAPRRRVSYRRERWDTPDGDFIDLDWVQEIGDRSRTASRGSVPDLPLIVLFHGLEGCSGSHYAHALMAHVTRRGWRGVVVHFRGCSGEPNRLARAYHSGDSAEIDWILRRLRAREGAPVYLVGVSLGGNALLKWLGELGVDAAEFAAASAAISAPVDLTAAGDTLGRGLNLIYTRAFLATLKRKSLAKLDRYSDLYDADRVRRSRTLREFDEVVTAPLHGFRGTDHYWTSSSSKPWLARIAVRTLVLNARNDPFLPEWALPRTPDVSAAVTLEQPDEGGHVGFVAGPFPGNLEWLPQRIIQFFGRSR